MPTIDDLVKLIEGSGHGKQEKRSKTVQGKK
jgi:hypothetical protein